MKNQGSILYVLLGTIFLILILYVALTFTRVVPNASQETTVVFISPNTSVKKMAYQLHQSGVLEEPWKFRLLGRLMHVERKLRPGEYRFKQPSAPLEVLNMLLEGKVLLHKVTFPEGTTMNEMGDILGKEKLVDTVQFKPLMKDFALLQKFQIPGSSFEGFLFPDTYYFSRMDDTLTILKTMHERFRNEITDEKVNLAKALGLNLLQWVTLASIIEKESGVITEQPIISSVFHNRLKKKMRLQSDPTVIYGIPNYDGNIHKKDLLTPTPYNTYTNYGLPPGPIANPGKTALDATIHPAQTAFLYFVAKKDGTHIFAKTYEEHAKNVTLYQLNHAPSPPPLPSPPPKKIK